MVSLQIFFLTKKRSPFNLYQFHLQMCQFQLNKNAFPIQRSAIFNIKMEENANSPLTVTSSLIIGSCLPRTYRFFSIHVISRPSIFTSPTSKSVQLHMYCLLSHVIFDSHARFPVLSSIRFSNGATPGVYRFFPA